MARWLAGVALGLVLATPALAQTPRQNATPPAAERELSVVNRTTTDITEIYVSPTSSDQWGEDRLGDDALGAGKSFRVRLGRTRDCRFDLRVLYEDGRREERNGQDICRNRQVIFDGSAATAPPPPEAPEHKVTLQNRSRRAIQQVFISSADAPEWGDDRLTDGTVAPGESTTLAYRGPCVADLRIVFANRAAEERRGLDLCDTPALSITPGWTTADDPPTPGPETIDVVNHTSRDVVELYLRPMRRADPGPDLLADKVIPPGGHLAVPLDRGEDCRFAARAVLGGPGEDKVLDGIDLCATQELVLEP